MYNILFLLLIFGFHSIGKAESYAQLNSNVRQFQMRVKEKQNQIKELSEKKSALKDQAAVRAILDEMISSAKEMKENFVRFQKEKKRLMYEFPQKGDLTERQYKHFEVETIEDMNALSNIDLRLKGVLSSLEKTYEKPPEVLEMEKKKKEKSQDGVNKHGTKATHATSIKTEPSPSPTNLKLSY